MDISENVESPQSWLNRPLTSFFPRLTIEHLLIALILIAAIVSRFYDVGLRVMSHDEVNHVVPSYELYQGNGYSHDPITHGPLQFHLLAASYFLFGDTDFASRIPAALFSIATIAFVMFAFKRYLGKTGAILAGLFFLISPYMLFYGRYTRNEAFVALFGVVMLYAVLRYLETGKHVILYLFTAVLALHFATKETSFIYTAELLIFLAVLFIRDVTKLEWKKPSQKGVFIIVTMTALLFIGLALGAGIINSSSTESQAITASALKIVLYASLGLAAVGIILAAVIAIIGVSWQLIKNIRSFDLLILTISMILPQLIALPISILGWDPLDYSQTGLIRTSIFLAGAAAISIALGLLWKPKLWLGNIALFYGIFTILYTTFFTNGQGFFTGMVGSLGYWLSQQGVHRGEQPWFFFAILQVPLYEYLPAIGTILAFIVGIKHKLFLTDPDISPAKQAQAPARFVQLPLPESDGTEPGTEPGTDTSNETGTELVMEEKTQKLPVLTLLIYWSVLSLMAYSIAGEKMPWLTVHVTLPMLLAAAFGIGYLVDTIPFKKLANVRGALTLLLLPVFLISLGETIRILTSPNRPFAGSELSQLQTTSTFIFAVFAAALSGWGLLRLFKDWTFRNIFKVLLATGLAILAVLTGRSAYQASYINFDTAKEFLVYAHSARGPKDVLEQVQEISTRTTGGNDIKVAYIGDALYPYWWYFREYPNKMWIKDQLTRDLLNYPVIISDDEQYSKTLAILKDGYTDTKYTRLVWPMQDYFSLTWKGLWKGIIDPAMRQAIFQIWLNKDYTQYAALANNSGLTLETWQPSQSIHLFIKKDIVADIWSYGTLPSQTVTESKDPYEGKYVTLVADKFFGSSGVEDGQFTIPHGIALAPSGSLYIADSQNHRIQKFSQNGEFLESWGSYGSVDAGSAPGGTFNEPWGIAVGPDGSVYVADTWNYRIQKFSADGKFITMWGEPGPAESPTKFWGPRGITVDKDGLVYITDTGNNRVVIFDENGIYQTQFGINGVNDGEFDEPVGIAVDDAGLIYVADTWNQRIQVFEPASTGGYQFLRQWPVVAWYGQSVNNKPFLAVDNNGSLFVTDPDAFRVLQFSTTGDFIRGWGDASSGIDGFGSPSGLVVDADGNLWVTDAENNYVLHFTLPADTAMNPVELPAIPQGLTYNSDSGVLENSDSLPVYRLDLVNSEWVPLVSDEILSLLGNAILPQKDFLGNWVLLDENDNLLYTWDPVTYQWIAPIPTQ